MGAFGMDTEISRRAETSAPKRLSLLDLVIVVAAGVLIVLGNVGVVRALDVALDALRR